MMMLPLVTSLIALSLIQAKHLLIETKNNSTAHQVGAVIPVLPIKAKEEYKSPIEAKEEYRSPIEAKEDYKSLPKMKLVLRKTSQHLCFC